MAENIDGSVYHMVRTGVVPAASVGPQLTGRDAAMLFLETTQTTGRKKGEKQNSGQFHRMSTPLQKKKPA